MSSMPFIAFGRARDPELTVRLPGFLAVRALALGMGFAVGTLAELRGAIR
jgi:hypothetical protein